MYIAASSHHQELWNPDWNLRTLVLSLRGFMITPPHEMGGLMASIEERVRLARLSREWICPDCGTQHATLLSGTDSIVDTVQRDHELQQSHPQKLAVKTATKSALRTKKTRNTLVKIGTASAAIVAILYYGAMI
jgi:ubiquitin-conjugating enzyme E2 J1